MGRKEHPFVWYFDQDSHFAGDQHLKQLQPEKKGEKVNMCKAIDILIADGERRGEERGFQLGAAMEREKIKKKWNKKEKEPKPLKHAFGSWSCY